MTKNSFTFMNLSFIVVTILKYKILPPTGLVESFSWDLLLNVAVMSSGKSKFVHKTRLIASLQTSYPFIMCMITPPLGFEKLKKHSLCLNNPCFVQFSQQ